MIEHIYDCECNVCAAEPKSYEVTQLWEPDNPPHIMTERVIIDGGEMVVHHEGCPACKLGLPMPEEEDVDMSERRN